MQNTNKFSSSIPDLGKGWKSCVCALFSSRALVARRGTKPHDVAKSLLLALREATHTQVLSQLKERAIAEKNMLSPPRVMIAATLRRRSFPRGGCARSKVQRPVVQTAPCRTTGARLCSTCGARTWRLKRYRQMHSGYMVLE